MSSPDSDRAPQPDWWRSAVVYQIYPRSFADADNDGTGDIRGIIQRLPYVKELGVDAIWVSPWYPSPLADGGYDVSDYRDIHPWFGTLTQADEFITKAHELNLRVLIDLVPNHCSDEHPWFQRAIAGGPGCPERDLFVFRDGKGPGGQEPPNNWLSLFGGAAWERVRDRDADGTRQWYLHMFDVKQPDWNWENPTVVDEFDDILRFWFNRGVDGFRIDVADSMAKDPRLPDVPIDPKTNLATKQKFEGSPVWDWPSLEKIHRHWRTVADEYADSDLGSRIFVSEAYLTPADRLAKYLEPGRLHTTFNFDALLCEWSEASLRNVINLSRAAHRRVGAPCTWVLANHDTPRIATRYGKTMTGVKFNPDGLDPAYEDFDWNDMASLDCDIDLGRKRARAAVLLELALPGGAYIYQGDELGLDEIEDLPDEVLQDPSWERSGHTVRGRDGCRVPIPWHGQAPGFGFTDGEPWLPMPVRWAGRTVADQLPDPTSHLSLYRAALAERRRNPALGDGDIDWADDVPAGVLAFDREPDFRCMVNFAAGPVPLPPGFRVLVASGDHESDSLDNDEAVWLAR